MQSYRAPGDDELAVIRVDALLTRRRFLLLTGDSVATLVLAACHVEEESVCN